MTRSDFSRYAMVSRRTALSGVLGAALLAAAGCSNDDSALSGTGGGQPASSPTTGASASTSSPSASASSSSTGTALPSSASLSVAFTFAAATGGGGPVRNPYVAVWLEDADGALVKTVALWHEDRGGQDRWLNEMRAFSALDATDAETVSSATRQPGSYTVAWDGSTVQGDRAVAGTYQLFIEGAREHGPYELVQQELSLGSKAETFTLSPNGELTSASAAYTV